MKDGKQMYKHCEELAGGEEKKNRDRAGWGKKKYAGGKWSEACFLFIYQSDNRTSCNVKCKKIISRLQTSAMCCNIFVNMQVARGGRGAIYLSCVPFVLEQKRFAGVTGLIADINNFFFLWEKGSNKTGNNNYNNNDDSDNMENKAKRDFFLPSINVRHQSGASKGKYT